MSQYRPLHEARGLPVIGRRPTRAEVEEAIAAGRAAGLRNLLLDGKPVALCRDS